MRAKTREIYTECLADWGPVLPRLAEIIAAPYDFDSFEKAHDEFCNSKATEKHFRLDGSTGVAIDILFEEFEGYFFGTLSGMGATFEIARSLIYSTYIAQGGKPHE